MKPLRIGENDEEVTSILGALEKRRSQKKIRYDENEFDNNEVREETFKTEYTATTASIYE